MFHFLGTSSKGESMFFVLLSELFRNASRREIKQEASQLYEILIKEEHKKTSHKTFYLKI